MGERLLRINQLIKKELSQIILREIDFPKDILVTLTRVGTLPDLMESRVWVSVIPQEKEGKVMKILNKNIYTLQQKLNKRLKMRPTPKIRFQREEKSSQAGRVEEILEQLKNERK